MRSGAFILLTRTLAQKILHLPIICLFCCSFIDVPCWYTKVLAKNHLKGHMSKLSKENNSFVNVKVNMSNSTKGDPRKLIMNHFEASLKVVK